MNMQLIEHLEGLATEIIRLIKIQSEDSLEYLVTLTDYLENYYTQFEEDTKDREVVLYYFGGEEFLQFIDDLLHENFSEEVCEKFWKDLTAIGKRGHVL